VTATLFDYNGVLIDDEDVHLAAFREAVRPLGIEITEEQYVARYLGFDDAGAFRAMLEDAGKEVTEARVNDLIEAKKPLYLARIDRARMFAGAKELVKRRAAKGRVGIVSGALRSEIELGLAKLGVESDISFIVSAEDAPRCKPDPMGYLIGIKRLEGEQNIVAIEDSLAGVQAARRAHLRVVGVAHTYPEAELLAAGADAAVHALADLDDEILG